MHIIVLVLILNFLDMVSLDQFGKQYNFCDMSILSTRHHVEYNSKKEKIKHVFNLLDQTDNGIYHKKARENHIYFHN